VVDTPFIGRSSCYLLIRITQLLHVGLSLLSLCGLGVTTSWARLRRNKLTIGVLQLLLLLLLSQDLLSVRLSYSLLERSLLDVPVVHEVEVEALADEGFSEHGDELLVVGLLFELQFSGVVEEQLELLGAVRAQVLYAGHCFLNLNLLVLLFLRFSRQTLPGQRSPDEIHKHYPDLL